MTRAHMSLVAPPETATGDWVRNVVAQYDGDVIVHVASCAEDLPRLASVIESIGHRAAFDQVVFDVGAGPGAGAALEELRAGVPVTRLGLPELPENLQDAIESTRCAAVVVHTDDHAGLCCALAAARLGTAIVRLGDVPASRPGRVIARLADVLLLRSPLDGGDQPVFAPERAFVIGNPLIDVVQRYARGALAQAAWRRYGLSPGGYDLAVLIGRVPFADIARVLSKRTERSMLLLEAPDGCDVPDAVPVVAAGFLERLSLERAARRIYTDSARVLEEAAVLGVPCHFFGDDARLPDVGREIPSPATARDRSAGARAADVFIANFARVRIG